MGVKEDARGLSMPEWAKHCADLRASKSLSARSNNALTLQVNDFFHHETWVPIAFPLMGRAQVGWLCQARCSCVSRRRWPCYS